MYEAKDASGKDVTLTGVDINTSEYRVAEARLKDGTDKEAWTAFKLTLNTSLIKFMIVLKSINWLSFVLQARKVISLEELLIVR